MTTATPAPREPSVEDAARDHTRTRYEAELEAECCPNCGEELGYVVTDGQSATRTDPAWREGYCKQCGWED